MTCELCLSDSGRYDTNNRCCQLRMILNMPSQRRQDYYQQIKREKGVEAANALIAEVNQARQEKRMRLGGQA